MSEPLLLTPVFHDKIWGGTKLHDEFKFRGAQGDHVGEAWVISAHPNGPTAVRNGDYRGQTVAELWESHRELFGMSDEAVFPLLTKILDANQDLSVQVHPDDEYAQAHAGELGKTECWYVLEAAEGAEIYYGHHAQTREELAELIKAEKWDQLLRKVPVKAGDFFYVPAGTIHALGAGVMVLETQQSSDTTYRLYDFDRVDATTGKLRDLHIEDSINVTTVPSVDPKLEITTEKFEAATITTLVEAPHFSVYKWSLDGGYAQFHRHDVPYTLATVIDGQATLSVDGMVYPLKKGDSFILPADVEDWTIQGHIDLIASHPGVQEA